MDDFIILAPSKARSKEIKDEIEKMINTKLNLKFNKKTNYFPNKNGVKFCGFKIYINKIMLSNSNKKRINQRVHKWNKEYERGNLDLLETGTSFISWKGHAMHETNQATVKSVIQKCKWIYKG